MVEACNRGHLAPPNLHVAKRNVRQLLIGIDTGGTFTDIVYLDGRRYGLCVNPQLDGIRVCAEHAAESR